MSQMTSFVIALNACWNVSVLVTTVMERPQNAQAPTGSGVSTRPVMVERKMARRVHAWGTTWAGHGTTNFTTSPTAMEISMGVIFAPFHTNPPPVASPEVSPPAAAAAAAGTLKVFERRPSAPRCPSANNDDGFERSTGSAEDPRPKPRTTTAEEESGVPALLLAATGARTTGGRVHGRKRRHRQVTRRESYLGCSHAIRRRSNGARGCVVRETRRGGTAVGPRARIIRRGARRERNDVEVGDVKGLAPRRRAREALDARG